MASPIGLSLAAAAFSLFAGAAMACPDVAACGGASAQYGYYSEQASFGPLADGPAYDAPPGPYGDEGYGAPPPYAGDPAYGAGPPQPYAGGDYPPPYADEPAYEDGPPPQAYGYQGSGYSNSSSSSYSSSSRSAYSSGSVSEYGYDSGWRTVPGPAPERGYEHHYGAMSVRSGEYDSGWRIQEGRPEVWCPPGSRYDRPHPRYGCGVAQVGVAPSFFYDTGGVGPAFIGGGGGGGGGVVVVGGGGRAFASVSASASARVHVGVHGGFHGRAGCGCHGGRGRR